MRWLPFIPLDQFKDLAGIYTTFRIITVANEFGRNLSTTSSNPEPPKFWPGDYTPVVYKPPKVYPKDLYSLMLELGIKNYPSAEGWANYSVKGGQIRRIR